MKCFLSGFLPDFITHPFYVNNVYISRLVSHLSSKAPVVRCVYGLTDHQGSENINHTFIKYGETFYGSHTALMHQSFVSTPTPPPPTGMGGDNDFLKIKALLKSLHCGDKWKVTAPLPPPPPPPPVSPPPPPAPITTGRHEKVAVKCYRPYTDQAFPCLKGWPLQP